MKSFTVLRRSRQLWSLMITVVTLSGSTYAFTEHVCVATSNLVAAGNTTAVDILPPWNAQVDLEAVSARATLRHFLGRHYVVNHSPANSVQVIDPETFATILAFSVGFDTNPQDIAVIDDQIAYVSCLDSPWLFRINHTTGTKLDSLSLVGFADPDGLPEMGTMAQDGNHLLIQIRRLDRQDNLAPVAPSYLAVVDVTTNQLVDVDPSAPGVQGIELQGTLPSFKMQLEGRRLYVSVPGEWFDGTGGVEEIDLDNLQSLGYLTSELQIPAAQMGTFILVSPEKGYVINHTDIALSSHLMSFTRPEGLPLEEVMFTLGAEVQNLAFDPATHQLFFPDSGGLETGIRILDTTTDTELTTAPVSTGLPPRDLVVARPPGPVAVQEEAEYRPSTNQNLPGAHITEIQPNPFNPRTTIGYHLDRQQTVRVAVFDLSGRRVAVLVDQLHEAGKHTVIWSGCDAGGRQLASGTYVVRIETPGGWDTRQLGLIR